MFKPGQAIEWTGRDGVTRRGIVAHFVPKGEPIPTWYTENVDHNISVRFRTHQLVSKRDDRYIVDCGTRRIETDDGVYTDVEYRMVPTSAPTTLISSASGQSDEPVLRSGIRLGPES